MGRFDFIALYPRVLFPCFKVPMHQSLSCLGITVPLASGALFSFSTNTIFIHQIHLRPPFFLALYA
jgi:hypothetical protein